MPKVWKAPWLVRDQIGLLDAYPTETVSAGSWGSTSQLLIGDDASEDAEAELPTPTVGQTGRLSTEEHARLMAVRSGRLLAAFHAKLQAQQRSTQAMARARAARIGEKVGKGTQKRLEKELAEVTSKVAAVKARTKQARIAKKLAPQRGQLESLRRQLVELTHTNENVLAKCTELQQQMESTAAQCKRLAERVVQHGGTPPPPPPPVNLDQRNTRSWFDGRQALHSPQPGASCRPVSPHTMSSRAPSGRARPPRRGLSTPTASSPGPPHAAGEGSFHDGEVELEGPNMQWEHSTECSTTGSGSSSAEVAALNLTARSAGTVGTANRSRGSGSRRLSSATKALSSAHTADSEKLAAMRLAEAQAAAAERRRLARQARARAERRLMQVQRLQAIPEQLDRELIRVVGREEAAVRNILTRGVRLWRDKHPERMRSPKPSQKISQLENEKCAAEEVEIEDPAEHQAVLELGMDDDIEAEVLGGWLKRGRELPDQSRAKVHLAEAESTRDHKAVLNAAADVVALKNEAAALRDGILRAAQMRQQLLERQRRLQAEREERDRLRRLRALRDQRLILDTAVQCTIDEDMQQLEDKRVRALLRREELLRGELSNVKMGCANVLAFSAAAEVDLACPCCLDTMGTPEALWPCGHSFCASCIDTMAFGSEGYRCHLCGVVSNEGAVVNHSLDAIATHWQISSGTKEVEKAITSIRDELAFIQRELDHAWRPLQGAQETPAPQPEALEEDQPKSEETAAASATLQPGPLGMHSPLASPRSWAPRTPEALRLGHLGAFDPGPSSPFYSPRGDARSQSPEAPPTLRATPRPGGRATAAGPAGPS